VRVQGVVSHRGHRRGDEQDGALVRVQGVTGHRGPTEESEQDGRISEQCGGRTCVASRGATIPPKPYLPLQTRTRQDNHADPIQCAK
jgi:hypothetical protein